MEQDNKDHIKLIIFEDATNIVFGYIKIQILRKLSMEDGIE